jgi:hypothetical protein
MNFLLYRGRQIEFQFACIPQGGIPIFTRSLYEPEDRVPVYVYCDEHAERGWRSTIFPRKIIAGMHEFCPDPFLTPYEYRVWNEHMLVRIVRGLRGDGVLTLIHRMGLSSDFGLCWSLYPLCFASRHMTDEPPLWWGAEGRSNLDFSQLQRRVLAQLRAKLPPALDFRQLLTISALGAQVNPSST